MAQKYSTWEGPGTYVMNEPALAPLADYEVFVYCDSYWQAESAIREYESNYGFTPIMQRVEVERGHCYC